MNGFMRGANSKRERERERERKREREKERERGVQREGERESVMGFFFYRVKKVINNCWNGVCQIFLLFKQLTNIK